ncbi:MAG TPA: hypothetical protein VEJ87_07190 [Acidimicrobiales bacterium]|nr:hypothetical protein [Acidimicrobiales bacterium]
MKCEPQEVAFTDLHETIFAGPVIGAEASSRTAWVSEGVFPEFASASAGAADSPEELAGPLSSSLRHAGLPG